MVEAPGGGLLLPPFEAVSGSPFVGMEVGYARARASCWLGWRVIGRFATSRWGATLQHSSKQNHEIFLRGGREIKSLQSLDLPIFSSTIFIMFVVRDESFQPLLRLES